MGASLTSLEESVCRAIAGRDAQMRADLAAHVAIPTGYNNTSALDEYRGVLIARLEALGASTELIAGDPKPAWLGGNRVSADLPPTAVCRRCEGRPGPRVLIAGHIDTVFDPAGTFLTMRTSDDGRIGNGPGVVDMKGGILIAVNALEALAEAGVETAWAFSLNSDEETGSYHSERALRRVASEADVGIALEPALPDGSLAISRKGSGQFMIEARGRSAHAGREFEKGVSAVYALAHALVAVEGMVDMANGVSVNVGPLTGGIATNVVPDLARAYGNVRFPDAEAADRLGVQMDAIATAVDALPALKVERSFNRPAKAETPQVRRLAEGARGAAESLGQELPFTATGGVCDGNILQDAGLATIDTLGVRGGDLHRETEWIDLTSLVERSQLLAVLLMRLAEGRVEVA